MSEAQQLRGAMRHENQAGEDAGDAQDVRGVGAQAVKDVHVFSIGCVIAMVCLWQNAAGLSGQFAITIA
jgi:hypothetical protein